MNLSMIVYLLGWILLVEGGLLLIPAFVSLLYAESAVWSFLVTAAICAVCGVPMILRKPKSRHFYLKDGFIVTGLTWILISIFGALPFVLNGCIPNYIDALFEIVSGFTTTGASILSDVEALPKGLLFWRSFAHWVGGMGVLVFLLALLPHTGGSHVNVMKAESPGPQVEKLVPSVQSTAKILYGIYIAMTALQLVLLLAAKMPLFDAVTLTFGTAGTGGFAVLNSGLATYTPLQQWIITVFMILFGVNFNFYFLLLLRKAKRAFAIEEVRWYFIIILAAVAMISLNIAGYYSTVEETVRNAALHVGSIITTTGYSSVDFDLWPTFSKTILVVLMFVGACAGSTGGGMKVSRFVVLFKTIRQELRHVLNPSRVSVTVMDGKQVSHEVLRSINVYIITFVAIFAGSVLLISLDGFDPTTNFTAVAATLNNIGPGLAAVGPTQNFSIYSAGAKLVLIFDMLAGRLELFPMLLLFSRETWRKF